MKEAWCPLRLSYRDSLVDVPKVIRNPYVKRCPEGIMGENVLNELVGLGAAEGQPGLRRGNTSMQGWGLQEDPSAPWVEAQLTVSSGRG